jgi:nicotinamide-nucleotide amidase
MTETLAPAIPDQIDRAVRAVLTAAHDRQMRLTAAESCTGGLLASLLTDVEGASHVFERGFVVYSDEAKCELLHIADSVVKGCGAVSRDVAIAMAEGALRASRADIAVAITGFAGPAGPDDEEGLVHFACAVRNGPIRHREAHFGPIGRGPVRIECIRVALELYAEAL